MVRLAARPGAIYYTHLSFKLGGSRPGKMDGIMQLVRHGLLRLAVGRVIEEGEEEVVVCVCVCVRSMRGLFA